MPENNCRFGKMGCRVKTLIPIKQSLLKPMAYNGKRVQQIFTRGSNMIKGETSEEIIWGKPRRNNMIKGVNVTRGIINKAVDLVINIV